MGSPQLGSGTQVGGRDFPGDKEREDSRKEREDSRKARADIEGEDCSGKEMAGKSKEPGWDR